MTWCWSPITFYSPVLLSYGKNTAWIISSSLFPSLSILWLCRACLSWHRTCNIGWGRRSSPHGIIVIDVDIFVHTVVFGCFHYSVTSGSRAVTLSHKLKASHSYTICFSKELPDKNKHSFKGQYISQESWPKGCFAWTKYCLCLEWKIFHCRSIWWCGGQAIVSAFARGTAKPRAHFSYCVMPHQADDNPGNSWEVRGGPSGSSALQGVRG